MQMKCAIQSAPELRSAATRRNHNCVLDVECVLCCQMVRESRKRFSFQHALLCVLLVWEVRVAQLFVDKKCCAHLKHVVSESTLANCTDTDFHYWAAVTEPGFIDSLKPLQTHICLLNTGGKMKWGVAHLQSYPPLRATELCATGADDFFLASQSDTSQSESCCVWVSECWKGDVEARNHPKPKHQWLGVQNSETSIKSISD